MHPIEFEALVRRLDRLERLQSRWRLAFWVLVACVVVLGIFGLNTARSARAQARPLDRPEAPLPTKLDPMQLAEARKKLSRQALDILDRTIQRGAPLDNQTFDIYRWSYQLLGTQIYLSMSEGELRVEDPEVYLAVAQCGPKAERLAAFEAHWRRMKRWEERLRPLADKGIMSTYDFLEIQSHRLQAELWLARERLKEKPANPKAAP